MDAETGSKMDLDNLATVICPNILYARGQNAVRDETFGALRVVTHYLENQDEFFTVPTEFLPILHDQEYFANSMDLPAKEFMRKCDTYFKIKATNGRILPPAQVNGASTRHPHGDRAMNNAQLSSDRTRSPQAFSGIPQGVNGQSSSTSLPSVQAMSSPRMQYTDEVHNPPRPLIGTPVPRPISYAVPRASSDHGHMANPSLAHANADGYPTAVRQRT